MLLLLTVFPLSSGGTRSRLAMMGGESESRVTKCTRPVFPPRVCVLAFHFLCVFFFLYEAACVFRTQEELRVREEDQQTITVEVELKRHDSEPTISVPQPSPEIRYSNNTRINTM